MSKSNVMSNNNSNINLLFGALVTGPVLRIGHFAAT